MDGTVASPSLAIDTGAAIARIEAYLRDLVRQEGAQGVILGLSGGLDSSVLATLAVRALGPEAVRVVYLFDRTSDAAIASNARRMAEWLNLDLEVHDITAAMRARGVYRPVFIKLLQLSPAVASLSVATYRLICRENPFLSSLRAGGGERLRPWWKRLMFSMTMAHVDAGFQARHIFRRGFLEREASARGLVLIGAANLSEFEVGWFVKDGIDDLPVQPMSGLYKTQVRQLARALDLPETVREQLPSPDMGKGVSDEFGIGHDYAVIDLVVDGTDRGLSVDDLVAGGLDRAEVEDILAIRRLSHWKRASPHRPPPVVGRAGSLLRCDSRAV